MSSIPTPLLPLVARCVLLAIAYAVSGRLSMLLAVPPGFASAIFPPVGISLGAVLIWGRPLLAGVFIGSTVLNVSISVSAGAALSLKLLPVAMGIAAGSTLQVWWGAGLTRRILVRDPILSQERDVLLFMLLGGPLSCLVGASVGVSVLLTAGLIPASDAPHNWVNWWVGDSIGVLVMAPLMLIGFGRPRHYWRGRINPIAVPLLISGALVIVAFLWSSKSEHQQNMQRFVQQAQLMSSSIKMRLDISVNVLRMADLVDTALAEYPKINYQLELTDVTYPANTKMIYGSLQTLPDYARKMVWTQQWNVAGRRLQIRMAPSLDYLAEQHSQQSWAILAGGLILTSMLGVFLLNTSGRTHRIQQLVDERTLALSLILSNAVQAIISFDEDNKIIAANPAAGRLFACDNAALTGRDLCALIPALEQERDNLLGLSCELSGQRDDGQIIAIDVSLSVVDINGSRTYTCMGHDLSERKKMERLKNEFVATVSHELRTPLTSISGALGLLANGVTGELTPKVQSLVDIAKSNAERLITIVSDILDFERLESGQFTISAEPHELPALLQLAIEQNQGYAERFGVGLKMAALPSRNTPTTVLVDKQRFLQIMANLLSNAIKFSPPAGDVIVGVEYAPHSVKIMVKDCGPGVPEDFRDRIFQKFAQADSSDARQRGGTGLGLSITKVLVERMNGYISYHSVTGEGTTFYVIFPLH